MVNGLRTVDFILDAHERGESEREIARAINHKWSRERIHACLEQYEQERED